MVDVTREKKNPVVEWAFYYFGTLISLYFLDKYGALFAGRSALDLFGPTLSLKYVVDPRVTEYFWFAALGMALVYPMTLWRKFVKTLFKPLAQRGCGLHEKSLKHDKFLEQAWLAVHYTITSALEIYSILKVTPNVWASFFVPPMVTEKSRYFFVSSCEEVEDHHKEPLIRLVYLTQYTFYFMELATLVLDKRSRSRSDAFVYAIHHVLTVFLISFSFLIPSTHVGILVLLFHDIPDIFLPIAKCFVYTEDHARANFSRKLFKTLEILGVVFFVIFLITFGGLRLILFPTLIYVSVYGAAWNARDYLVSRDGPNPYTQDPADYTYCNEVVTTFRNILTVALVLLFPLHVYWFRCALRVAYFAVMGIYDDERSDDDEYSDDESEKKKKK